MSCIHNYKQSPVGALQCSCVHKQGPVPFSARVFTSKAWCPSVVVYSQAPRYAVPVGDRVLTSKARYAMPVSDRVFTSKARCLSQLQARPGAFQCSCVHKQSPVPFSARVFISKARCPLVLLYSQAPQYAMPVSDRVFTSKDNARYAMPVSDRILTSCGTWCPSVIVYSQAKPST